MTVGRALLVFATGGALALLGYSYWVEPVTPLLASLALLCYLGLLVVGALTPGLQMFGEILLRTEGSKQGIALTFDDGPDLLATPIVLDALREAGAQATFFVVGRRAAAHPELLRRIVEEGHELALHTMTHSLAYAWLPPKKVEADILELSQLIEKETGKLPLFFRPPVGQVSPRTAAGARRAGVSIVGWSARARDGVQNCEPQAALARLRRGLEPGAILLLHDKSYSGQASAGVELLPELLQEAAAAGLKMRTLSGLLRDELE